MGDAVQGAKKLDRRVVRSRRLIIDAFERLLLKESLEDITVSAIAREADILTGRRSTSTSARLTVL